MIGRLKIGKLSIVGVLRHRWEKKERPLENYSMWKDYKSFFSRLWNCRIWKFHKWTCNHEQGIKPTKEQLENGIEGFYDYAKMYCKICGTESKLSKQIRCKYKN